MTKKVPPDFGKGVTSHNQHKSCFEDSLKRARRIKEEMSNQDQFIDVKELRESFHKDMINAFSSFDKLKSSKKAKKKKKNKYKVDMGELEITIKIK